MTVKIHNKKLNLNKQNTIVLFVNSNLDLKELDNNFLKKFSSLIKKSIKLNKDSITKFKDFFNFDLNPLIKLIIIKIPKDHISSTDNEKLGARFFNFIKTNLFKEISFIDTNLKLHCRSNKNFFNEFLSGIIIKSYEFDKYKTKRNKTIFQINIHGNFEISIFKKNNKQKSLIDGLNFTKDLVSEPGNILHPDEYVKRILKLKSLGLKVTILDKKKLKQIGMNALLGVGQGSIRGSYLAIIEWKGSSKKQQPLAFVGKGVCFDTGGISLKPAKFMEDMTYDMAGSAVVVGLMKTLALRKAKVNAVGVVGLVENMPDGNAQRPGDIVKSYSGKTIEILNTDAEGRLVLADALSYTEKKFKPKFIVDLATLTGAIIVSLGSEYAGLFSNDDKISDQLSKAGEKVGEKVWRMPLNDNYDKLIDSKKADMQNINYVGGAGSTTAAQFLQRFILNKTPWAHLDIAGMAFSKYGGALNSGGATGYGVRLLNQLIEDNYE
jgi:leucyl aminopeptidase